MRKNCISPSNAGLEFNTLHISLYRRERRFDNGFNRGPYDDNGDGNISPRKELSRSLSSDNWRSRKDDQEEPAAREPQLQPGEENNQDGDWRRAGPRDKCEYLSSSLQF